MACLSQEHLISELWRFYCEWSIQFQPKIENSISYLCVMVILVFSIFLCVSYATSNIIQKRRTKILHPPCWDGWSWTIVHTMTELEPERLKDDETVHWLQTRTHVKLDTCQKLPIPAEARGKFTNIEVQPYITIDITDKHTSTWIDPKNMTDS